MNEQRSGDRNNYFTTISKHKRLMKITNEQKEVLIDFMEEHPELIHNTRKSTSFPTLSEPDYTPLWEDLMQLLDGCCDVPSGKKLDEWKKTWSDLKRHVEIKTANISAGLISPSYSMFEERILKLIQEHKEPDKYRRRSYPRVLPMCDENDEANEDCEPESSISSLVTEVDIKPDIHYLEMTTQQMDPLFVPKEESADSELSYEQEEQQPKISDPLPRKLRPHKSISYAKMLNLDTRAPRTGNVTATKNGNADISKVPKEFNNISPTSRAKVKNTNATKQNNNINTSRVTKVLNVSPKPESIGTPVEIKLNNSSRVGKVQNNRYESLFKNVHPSQRKRLTELIPSPSPTFAPQIKKRKLQVTKIERIEPAPTIPEVTDPYENILMQINELKELEEKRFNEQQEMTNKIAKAVETLATGLLETIRNLSEATKRNAETIEELRAKF